MPNLNKVFFIGRLTRDPVLNSSKTGNHFCTFSLAINRKYTLSDGTQKEDVEFVNIVVSNRLSEACFRYLHKGDAAFVEGRYHTREWQDKQGVTRKEVEIIAETVQFLETRSGQSPNTLDPAVEQAFRKATPDARSHVPPAPVAPLTPAVSETAQDTYANDTAPLPDDDGEVF